VQAAEKKSATGVYNRRYCEILELEGLPPDATVTVWNTAGLIEDPNLSIDDLASLAGPLALPEGWAYVTSELERDLTLTAEGSATVIQDELRNTYQRRT